MEKFAPVAVFAYRRPDHLRRTLASLMRCDGFDQSPIIIFFDGARDQSEMASVMKTRDVAQLMLGGRAHFRFNDYNRGLSASVISGVSDVIDEFGRVIVVEDDLQLSFSFLTFMNRGLERYVNDNSVFQISGFQFADSNFDSMTDALFLPFISSWGWATWKRAWDNFDPIANGWAVLKDDSSLRHRFNLDGVYDYSTMLFRQMEGRRDSWAIRWYWSVFVSNGLALFPPVSLVRNTGFDGTGSHGRALLRRICNTDFDDSISFIDFPPRVELDLELYERVKKAVRLQNGGFSGYVADKIRHLIGI